MTPLEEIPQVAEQFIPNSEVGGGELAQELESRKAAEFRGIS
jgi:hypothetical protein